MIFKCIKLVQMLTLLVLLGVCLPCSAIRPFLHFLVHFLLLLVIDTFNISDDIIFKCVRSVQIVMFVALMWVCLPCPTISQFVLYLVYFPLLLAIETFIVNDDIVFRCVRLVWILMLVTLMWLCLPHPAKRPFVHF